MPRRAELLRSCSRGARRFGLCALFLAAGCREAAPPVAAPSAPAASTSSAPLAHDPLAIDPAALASEPKVLAKLAASPFAYFRYIAGPFSQAVCERYQDKNALLPTVRLHGDAHVEQYAVADDGFGIVDFDDATQGPPTIDWLRYSSSLWLAARFDPASAETAIAAFLRGYREGLAEPEAVLTAPEPAASRRVRAKNHGSAVEWLDAVTKMIVPPDHVSAETMTRVRAIYQRSMLEQNPDLSSEYFALKAGGLLDMGIGSVHETKFLVRVEGPTAAPADDVILEKKQMKQHIFGQCNRTVSEEHLDPRRVVEAQAKFSRTPQRLLGYVEVDTETFYVHAWRVHYRELGLEDIATAAELADLAHDVGLQLGRGHPLFPPASESGRAERRGIADALAKIAPEIPRASKELAERVQRAQERLAAGYARAPH